MLSVLRYRDARRPTSECKLATGRSCLLHLIDVYKPGVVFMPGYVPDGVIRPFTHANVQVRLYKLKADLSPDDDHLAQLMMKNPMPRPIVIVIHYFGFKTPSRNAADFAHAAGGICVEDCAQALCGNASRTEHGDIALYSMNKFLPVVDGATMMSFNNKVDVSCSPGPPLHRDAIYSYEEHLSFNAKIAREKDIRNFPSDAMRSAKAYDDYYRWIDDDMSPRAQSESSRVVCAAEDFNAMSNARYQIAQFVADDVHRWCKQLPVFAFPIRCFGHRAEILGALLQTGVVATTMIERWTTPPADFEHEHNFIDDHLLLPIGQSVQIEDALRMNDILRSFPCA